MNFRKSLGALVLLSGALLSAQTPPNTARMAEWRVKHLTSALSLSSTQQTEAQTIFANEAAGMSTVHTGMEAAHKALAAAVEANDAAAIAAQSTQIGTLTAQETQARATAEAAFYILLNQDQQAKYKEMMSHDFGGRGPGHGPRDEGPRGPRGDGPPPPPSE